VTEVARHGVLNDLDDMDVQRFFEEQMSEADTRELACGSVAVYSTKAPDKQTANEDAAAVVAAGSDVGILVIADGMGGERAGEQASRRAVEELVAAIQQAPADEPSLRAAILNGFENANRAISELGVGAATTLVVAEVQGATVRPYHAGDSLILVVGQRGKVKLQTVSHSPVGYAVESGLLDEADAMHHDERHVVSNMLGSPDMRIEVGPTIKLAPRDTLLLASDGLFDNLHTQEIIERVRKGPLAKVAGTLADDCRRRMQVAAPDQPSKPDDLTFIAFRRRVR
jgi:serine/threonine protein phosphatase PrpC